MKPHELLRKIPLFNSLGDHEINELGSSLRIQVVKQGHFIFRKGDEGTSLYFLKQGAIKILLPSRMGDEIIVSIFSSGDFFGEMALLDGKPRPADAKAIRTSELYVLSRNDFVAFLQSNLHAFDSVLSQLAKRLRSTYDLLEDVCFLTISARLAKLIVELSKYYGKQDGENVLIDILLTQKELGDMIGATRESINKELKTLREKGLIKVEENRIKICNMTRLKRRAY